MEQRPCGLIYRYDNSSFRVFISVGRSAREYLDPSYTVTPLWTLFEGGGPRLSAVSSAYVHQVLWEDAHG